jgi:hypothetical protein
MARECDFDARAGAFVHMNEHELAIERDDHDAGSLAGELAA